MSVQTRGLAKRYGVQPVLTSIDLEVPAGTSVSVLGPSGSGKTTLLRLLAGLELPDAGTVTLGGREASGSGGAVAPHRRGIGFAFQRSALWPHMTVGANILFGVARLDRSARQERLDALLAELELDGLAGRYPDELSGGQARRAALGRALAPEPPILLLDEPLTNLDEALRSRVLERVRDRVARTGATLVYVTHDEAEARRMAGRVLRLADGRLEPGNGPVSPLSREVIP